MVERAAAATDEMAAGFWDALGEELGLWRKAGRRAAFWWRDDDAVAAGPALARLADLGAEHGAPLALAAVPAKLEASLAPALADRPHVTVLQHGYAHANHAKGLGVGAWELGLQRPAAAVIGELAIGREIMERAFAEQFMPVVAAPWNRIDRRLLPGLAGAGFAGFSAAGERPLAGAEGAAPQGLVEANIQFDLLDWKGGRRFRGEASAEREIVGHLRRRRLGMADAGEPTGILTHHLVLDEASWRFLGELLGFVARHPAAAWLPAREIFGPSA